MLRRTNVFLINGRFPMDFLFTFFIHLTHTFFFLCTEQPGCGAPAFPLNPALNPALTVQGSGSAHPPGVLTLILLTEAWFCFCLFQTKALAVATLNLCQQGAGRGRGGRGERVDSRGSLVVALMGGDWGPGPAVLKAATDR